MGYTSTGAEKSTWCAARTPTPATRELYPNWQSGNELPVDSAPAWLAGRALADEARHRWQGSVRGVLVPQVNWFGLGLAGELRLP